jgi:hypothetical protein
MTLLVIHGECGVMCVIQAGIGGNAGGQRSFASGLLVSVQAKHHRLLSDIPWILDAIAFGFRTTR